MKFINLFREQIGLSQNTKLELDYREFMNGYYCLFSKFNNINISKDRLIEVIDDNISQIKNNEQEEMLQFSLRLENEIVKISEKIEKKLEIINAPDTVLFIGDGSIDGHGIIVEGKTYGIFELTTLKNSINLYNSDLFLAHELIHPIHYRLNKEYFPKEWGSVEEYYFKRMISEGIATYFSKEACETSVDEAYWFGYLKLKELHKWISYCEEIKSETSIKLSKSISEKILDSNLYRQLFSIEGYDNISKYRLAYYYGYHIIEDISKSYTFEQILKLKYKDLRHYMLDYFSINNVD
ncbi:DUF2268 domain-containing protein [Alkaliphilus pronyensis]|uniref:DUF2268 domain-containing protein n=1 Tax=Alkaliphilus pronyensis TaxID=1482732 RepID=A0A6I0F5J0_9FIRM|nr:hypothetical protein [Alkaliphilus pronyensis]KAB3531050.1 DUF2268 domain-containing protein [Alkaliphilus pronyensis]